MQTFKTNDGRAWQIAIDAGAVKRCKKAGYDLGAFEPDKPNVYVRIFAELDALAELVWAIVQPQAIAAGMSQEQFDAACDGDAYGAARPALLEALVDFFQRAGRQELAEAVGQIRATMEQAIAQQQERNRTVGEQLRQPATSGS